MQETLLLRAANVQDAPQLYQWDEKPHVRQAVSISGLSSFEADWEHELASQCESSAFYIAEVGGQPVGAMHIIDPSKEPTQYWGPISSSRRAIDIWLGEVQCLGRGVGTQMMNFAIEKCFSKPEVTGIVIDPLINNTASHRFYRRLGFQLLHRRQFCPESDCYIFLLTRTQWES